MTEPVFSPSTERFYQNIPEVYRVQDALQDWTLKRWLSGVIDILGEVELLVARLNYTTPDERVTNPTQDSLAYQRTSDPSGALPIGQTSDLVDPTTADTAWLPWLAQLVGTKLPISEDDVAWRLLIKTASSGWQAGSRQAIANAIKRVMSGPTYTVQYEDHYLGDEWTVHILTPLTEQSSGQVILDAVNITKPAGVIVNHEFFTTIPGDTVGWGETVTATINACPVTATTLYPSATLYPC